MHIWFWAGITALMIVGTLIGVVLAGIIQASGALAKALSMGAVFLIVLWAGQLGPRLWDIHVPIFPENGFSISWLIGLHLVILMITWFIYSQERKRC